MGCPYLHHMQLRNPTSLAARPIETMAPQGDRPETFPKGRVCSAGRKCPPGTLLSIYNPGSECAQCNPTKRKPRDEDFASLMAEAPGIA